MAAILCFSGCSHSGPSVVPQASPSGATPEVQSIQTVLDPSMAATDVVDPYAEMDRYAQEVFKPDRDLYNLLYRAVDAMEPSVDISSFKVSSAQVLDMYNCLYSEAQYRFYYLKKVKLSQDGKKVLFTYNRDSKHEVRRNRETFYAHLSHLVYNVAPKEYTDLQKVLAVYEYLCENANYSADMRDVTTFSPYSILVKHQGICNGFANLAAYALNRVGVPTEYVCNESHAWNIVTVGGKQYHMDITFGAGPFGGMANSLSTVLMDDKTRLNGLQTNGSDHGQIILGYPRENPKLPPVCTDTSFAKYNSIYFCYALDIDQGKVYFSDAEGIKRMNLNCTGVETLSAKASAFIMAVYDGVLYYLGGDNGQLYRLRQDGTSELLDDTKYLTYLAVVDGTLRYGLKYDGSEYKSIRLTTFDPRAWGEANTLSMPARSVPRSRSFAIKIEFSEPMDKKASWKDMVILSDSNANPLNVHMLWSEDGKTLTVRPKDCVADLGSVTVYVKSGAPSAGGGMLAKGYTMHVDVKAGE